MPAAPPNLGGSERERQTFAASPLHQGGERFPWPRGRIGQHGIITIIPISPQRSDSHVDAVVLLLQKTRVFNTGMFLHAAPRSCDLRVMTCYDPLLSKV